MFITLEGSEGCGKTSLMPLLADDLTALGYQVLKTREPGGTSIGDQVRAILADFKNTDMLPRSEVLLFQASRAQLVEQVIRPALARGDIVLSDRFAESTIAYQGYGHQLNIDLVRSIVEFATGGLKPDLALFLDVDVEEGLRRKDAGGDRNRLDTFDLSFYQRVRQGYLDMVNAEPQRWVVIDANGTQEEVRGEVRKVVLERLAGNQ
ncbi:MAG: dTMP kinase [Chloroflexota bacterium]|nr:dTMP kinase [Chloroflexota bacterium]